MRYSKIIVRSTLTAAAFAAITLVGISSVSNATAMSAVVDTPTQSDLMHEVAALGYSPQNLCAAGLNSNQTEEFLSLAIDEIGEQWDDLSSIRATIQTTATEIRRLERLVSQGHATTHDRDQLATARQSLTTAQSSLGAIQAAIRVEAEAMISGSQQAKLDQLIANNSLPIPTKYHVLDKSTTEWVGFRKAYMECQTNPDARQASQDLVDNADANFEVNLAQTDLDTNLSGIRQVFDSLLNGI